GGGRTPKTGFHSVIDRPERVSRVMPPITTITRISAQQTTSQAATAARLSSAVPAVAPSARLTTAVVEVNKKAPSSIVPTIGEVCATSQYRKPAPAFLAAPDSRLALVQQGGPNVTEPRPSGQSSLTDLHGLETSLDRAA